MKREKAQHPSRKVSDMEKALEPEDEDEDDIELDSLQIEPDPTEEVSMVEAGTRASRAKVFPPQSGESSKTDEFDPSELEELELERTVQVDALSPSQLKRISRSGKPASLENAIHGQQAKAREVAKAARPLASLAGLNTPGSGSPFSLDALEMALSGAAANSKDSSSMGSESGNAIPKASKQNGRTHEPDRFEKPSASSARRAHPAQTSASVSGHKTAEPASRPSSAPPPVPGMKPSPPALPDLHAKTAPSPPKKGGKWSDSETSISTIKAGLEHFISNRDWHKFHKPKDLAMAISIEAGELLELFLWTDEGISGGRPPAQSDRLREEVADVAITLLNLCNKEGIDLAKAIEDKLAKNGEKYPQDKARGSALKYDQLSKRNPR